MKINSFFTVCILSVLIVETRAQSIVIDETLSPQHLVLDVLLSENQNISNIQYTGHPNAIGFFSGGAAGICPWEGIIMSTGFVRDAIGPNNPLIEPSGVMCTPGDADLNTIVGGDYTFDASVLEFDFVAQTDILNFQFVFASEEYPEFVGMFNDVFAFLISGQNPAGGFYNKKNIALLPNTNIPITINNVNDTTNNQYFINYIDGANMAFDGLTTIINIEAKLVVGAVYHLKIVIADFMDDVLDSAIFLKAGSFSTGSLFAIQTDDNCLGEVSTFTSNANNIQSVLWNFGDSQTSTQLNPTHTYASAGTYTVTLEVTFTDNSTQTISKTIEIINKPTNILIEHE